jgi:hypothetical protein
VESQKRGISVGEHIAIIVVGLIALGFIWNSWRQTQRANKLEAKYLDAIEQIENLEAELNHSQSVAWNRLSDAQKDEAIRMG